MTIEPALDLDLALAHRLADAAGAISLSRFRHEPRNWRKSDGSLVTEADLAVEDTLRAQVSVERPDDSFLGEERGHTGSGRRRWIVDAIDGTVSFAAGNPEWATLIALEIGGRVAVSVCDEPANHRRYWAARGQGAFCSSTSALRQLRVSAARDITLARSYVPPPEWFSDQRARNLANALASATCPQTAVDHPAFHVAAGEYDLAVFLTAGAWDLAGPALIVEEAGGRFTDLHGRNELTSGNAVFSNGLLHDDVLRLISRT